MSTYEARLSALIEEISAAFHDVSRENGVSLSEAWVIDDYGSNAERAAARAEDTDTRWQDVPAQDIAHGYSCLSFLDNIGLRYYLPAYMVWTLHHWDAPDSNTPDFTLYALNLGDPLDDEQLRDLNRRLGRQELPDRQQMRDWNLNRYSVFTPEQSTAIAHFLLFMVKHHEYEDAQKAFDNYWGNFA